jgi:hypothetical protein
VAWVRERTIPTERPPLVGEISVMFCGVPSFVVSVTDPNGRILGFLDRTQIPHKITAYKATQTIKDTLYAMNTAQNM